MKGSTKETDKRKAERVYALKLAEGKEPNRRKIQTLLDALVQDYEINGKDVTWCRFKTDKLASFFGNIRIDAINKNLIDSYTKKRLAEGVNATVNRELALLRRSFNLADAPFPKISLLEENNVRKNFLTDEEFNRLVASAPEHLKPIIIFAYKTGCRKSEILSLKWSQLDLKNKVVRLLETKNGEMRTIPLDTQLVQMLGNIERVHTNIFTYRNQPIKDVREGFKRLSQAGLSNLVFHDLRRCAIRNFSRSMVPEVIAMKISGHKSRSVYDRYNIVSEADLHEGMKKREDTLTRAEKDAAGHLPGTLDKFLEIITSVAGPMDSCRSWWGPFALYIM